MKRMLLSAILAVGIHAYLLWANFGWMEKQPPFEPKPQRVILTLASRPVPKAEPVPIQAKPAMSPASEPEPISIPKPEPEPEPAPEPIPAPEPNPQPKPARTYTPEIKTVSPPLKAPKPSLFMSESEPAPYSRTEPITGEAIPEVPESVPQPEARFRTVREVDEQKQNVPSGPVEASSASADIREAKPRYRDNPPPHYPTLARKRNYQGTVILDVFIDKNGRVADMKIFSSSGYSTLDKAARATVEDWLFEPGMKGDEKIEMWVKIPIRFQLK